MTIPLHTLHDAAFWDRPVCLSCGSIQPDDHDPESDDCDFCSSPMTRDAAEVLALLSYIDLSDDSEA